MAVPECRLGRARRSRMIQRSAPTPPIPHHIGRLLVRRWGRNLRTKSCTERWLPRPATRLTFAEAIATRGAINLRSSVLGAVGTLLDIEDNRDGPVVHEGHLHPRPKTPVSTWTPRARSASTEPFVDGLGDLARRRLREVGSSSLLALTVCDQRELADDQRCSTRVHQRAVELARLVLEHPQAGDARREEGPQRRRCRPRHPEQDAGRPARSRRPLPRRPRPPPPGLAARLLARRLLEPVLGLPLVASSGRSSMCGVASLRLPWLTSARPRA